MKVFYSARVFRNNRFWDQYFSSRTIIAVLRDFQPDFFYADDQYQDIRLGCICLPIGK